MSIENRHDPKSTFIGITAKRSHEINAQRPYTQYGSWLAETSGILGCPVDCKYCFFQVDGLTPVKPKMGLSPEEIVDKLKDQPTYSPTMPVHFGSKTDAFSTKLTVEYYTQVLQCYGESEYKNPLVFITKKSIPDEFMDLSSKVKQSVLFYLSLSGLCGTAIEPNVSADVIKENFVRLRAKGLRAIHYWRPFLPQNSRQKDFPEMLDFVTKYATCSVLTGLRMSDGIRSNMISFWPELEKSMADIGTSGEFWPAGVRSHLIAYVQKRYALYPIFLGNTVCSVAYALGKADIAGHYNEPVCRESNCPQRALCGQHHHIPTWQTVKKVATAMRLNANDMTLLQSHISIKGAVASEKITFMRHALRFPVISDVVDYSTGYNWANVATKEEHRIIEVPWKDSWVS